MDLPLAQSLAGAYEMAIARSIVALLGTNETTGVSINDNTTSAGSEVDVLGNDTSLGLANVYLCATQGVTTGFNGTITVRVNPRRDTGLAYISLGQGGPFKSAQAYQWTVPAKTGKFFLGKITGISRYVTADAILSNNGVAMTNVAILIEIFNMS